MSEMSTLTRVSLALAFTALHPGLVLAQAQERAIYASVTHEAGAPVTALAATDFVVREDGVQREILRVSPATDALQIAVLVDTSQAIEPYVNDLRNALRTFFKDLQGKHDIALFGFGERPTLLADYTRDQTRLEAGVGRIFAQSGSAAYVLDAIVEVSRGLRKREEETRSVIVVITAEGPEFSQRYHETVLDELRESGTTLYSLVLARPGRSLLTDGAREREFTLSIGAQRTGGRREDLLTSMALTGRLHDLGAELNNQYRVVYARPALLIPPKRVDVSVNRPGVTVRAPRAPREPRTTS
jgi:Ca-activated chloride channel homolog